MTEYEAKAPKQAGSYVILFIYYMYDAAFIRKKHKHFFSASRLWFYFLSILLFGVVIYYMSSIRKDVRLLGEVKILWLLLAILSQGGTYFFTAIIYKKLLSVFKISSALSIWKLFKLSIVALFTDQLIPSAGISGNATIFNFLLKQNMPAADAFYLVMLQLITYYISMEIIILCIAVVSLSLYGFSKLFLIIFTAGFAANAVFAFLISFAGKKKTLLNLLNKTRRIKYIKNLLTRLIESFEAANVSDVVSDPRSFLRREKKTVVAIILCNTGVFLADAVTIFVLFRGLGVPLSIIAALTAYLLTRIISLLPVSPGALILYESGMTFFLTQLGAPVGTSIMVTLLYRFLSFWAPMPIGFFLFKKIES